MTVGHGGVVPRTDSPVDALALELGIGQPFIPSGTLLPQARMTIEFNRAVAGPGANPFAANITTTGHSLGDGIAGYAAMHSGKQGMLFGCTSFENTAAGMRGTAVGRDKLARSRALVYGNNPTDCSRDALIAPHYGLLRRKQQPRSRSNNSNVINRPRLYLFSTRRPSTQRLRPMPRPILGRSNAHVDDKQHIGCRAKRLLDGPPDASPIAG